MEKIPLYSVDLIKALDEENPSRCPSLNQPERSIWYEAGKRALIDGLLSVLKDSEKKVLEG
jgi:hypothetical protein